MDTLGQRIRSWRRLANITQGQLATTIGRSPGWLSHVERDLLVPHSSDLRRLARALHIDENTLRSTNEEPQT